MGVSILRDTNHENSHHHRLFRGGYLIPNVLIKPEKTDRDYRRALRDSGLRSYLLWVYVNLYHSLFYLMNFTLCRVKTLHRVYCIRQFRTRGEFYVTNES